MGNDQPKTFSTLFPLQDSPHQSAVRPRGKPRAILRSLVDSIGMGQHCRSPGRAGAVTANKPPAIPAVVLSSQAPERRAAYRTPASLKR